MFFLGQHGAASLPGGGERGIVGRRFEAQPAAVLQGRTGLEHAAAQLSGHSCREQVPLSEIRRVAGLVKESAALNRLFSALPPPQ